MRVLVSGGGTAGHVYPALALAALVASDSESTVAFVGLPDGIEARLAADSGVRFIPVRSRGWDRSRPWTLVVAVATAIASLVRCLRIIRAERADVVVGFGGYVSVPLALASVLAGVPLVLHEQNSVPGVANRVLSRWARAVCLTYDGSAERLAHPDRAVVTGNPVRASVLEADREAGRRAFGVGEQETLLLVFGGSRGARHLNTAIVNLYSRLSEFRGLRVVHIAGPAEAASVRASLEATAGAIPEWWSVLEYVDGMGDLLAAADLVVCRAGATTLAEVAALGKPAILVPYPYATDDHQTSNARPFVDAGAAFVFADSDVDGVAFGDTVTTLIADPGQRASMGAAASRIGRPSAATALVEVLRRASARTPIARLGGAR